MDASKTPQYHGIFPLAVFRQIGNLDPQATLAPRFLPLAQGRPFDLQ